MEGILDEVITRSHLPFRDTRVRDSQKFCEFRQFSYANRFGREKNREILLIPLCENLHFLVKAPLDDICESSYSNYTRREAWHIYVGL